MRGQSLKLNLNTAPFSNTSYSAAVVPAAGVPTPEPGTLLLFGSGLTALGILQKRTKFLSALHIFHATPTLDKF